MASYVHMRDRASTTALLSKTALGCALQHALCCLEQAQASIERTEGNLLSRAVVPPYAQARPLTDFCGSRAIHNRPALTSEGKQVQGCGAELHAAAGALKVPPASRVISFVLLSGVSKRLELGAQHSNPCPSAPMPTQIGGSTAARHNAQCPMQQTADALACPHLS